MKTGGDVERKARFETLVGPRYGELYRYAAWLSRDPGVAEVVVQESLLRAWKSLDSLKQDEAAKPWLFTIVRRENARYFEAKAPATVDIHELTPAQEAMIAAAEDPDLEDLRRAILELEDGYREPLVLQVLMGHSCNEIAAIMGIKPGAVLTRLHRARIKLKAVIEGEAPFAAASQADGV